MPRLPSNNNQSLCLRFQVITSIIIMINIYHISIQFKARINKYIHGLIWDIITRPYPNFNGSVTKPLLELWYGWVITSQCLTRMELHINALPQMLVCKRGPMEKKSKLCRYIHSHGCKTRGQMFYINLFPRFSTSLESPHVCVCEHDWKVR